MKQQSKDFKKKEEVKEQERIIRLAVNKWYF